MKSIDEHFLDWEGETFPYGYGTGEAAIRPMLKRFFKLCPNSGAYDYRTMENELGPSVAWLMINALCRAQMLEYGTSPRFARLTPSGQALKAYVEARNPTEFGGDADRDGRVECFTDHCNCDEPCANPFWPARKDTK
jgi:hypothetical protein